MDGRYSYRIVPFATMLIVYFSDLQHYCAVIVFVFQTNIHDLFSNSASDLSYDESENCYPFTDLLDVFRQIFLLCSLQIPLVLGYFSVYTTSVSPRFYSRLNSLRQGTI